MRSEAMMNECQASRRYGILPRVLSDPAAPPPPEPPPPELPGLPPAGPEPAEPTPEAPPPGPGPNCRDCRRPCRRHRRLHRRRQARGSPPRYRPSRHRGHRCRSQSPEPCDAWPDVRPPAAWRPRYSGPGTEVRRRGADAGATERLTAGWQMSCLPSWLPYCRAAPTECLPCLGKPVSSMIQAWIGRRGERQLIYPPRPARATATSTAAGSAPIRRSRCGRWPANSTASPAASSRLRSAKASSMRPSST